MKITSRDLRAIERALGPGWVAWIKTQPGGIVFGVESEDGLRGTQQVVGVAGVEKLEAYQEPERQELFKKLARRFAKTLGTATTTPPGPSA